MNHWQSLTIINAGNDPGCDSACDSSDSAPEPGKRLSIRECALETAIRGTRVPGGLWSRLGRSAASMRGKSRGDH
eukprot:3209072-Alexandrium_andersonii.AAC.1